MISTATTSATLLTLGAAGRQLGLTRQSVWKYVSEGKLPAERIGHLWFVRADDVARLVLKPRLGRPKAQIVP